MKTEKWYFASDFHLGAPNKTSSRQRERLIVQWLNQIKVDADKLFLVGDLFDFWFEYKYAIPKGFVRFQGKIAELVDQGIEVHFFIGNHDMWMFDYFEKEIGVQLHTKPIIKEVNGKRLFIGHGDGLGPGDYGYKFIKKVFSNSFFQWCFARLHPNFGIGVANFFSRKSRAKTGDSDSVFEGKENEWLATYCEEVLRNQPIDFFIFGHRHLPLDLEIGSKSRYINLGDWLKYNTFAVLEGNELVLNTFPSNSPYFKSID